MDTIAIYAQPSNRTLSKSLSSLTGSVSGYKSRLIRNHLLKWETASMSKRTSHKSPKKGQRCPAKLIIYISFKAFGITVLSTKKSEEWFSHLKVRPHWGKPNSKIFTARKRSLRRLCFHRCLSVHRGVSAPLHAGIHSPLGRHPPLAQWMLGYGQQVGGTHPTGMHSCNSKLARIPRANMNRIRRFHSYSH